MDRTKNFIITRYILIVYNTVLRFNDHPLSPVIIWDIYADVEEASKQGTLLEKKFGYLWEIQERDIIVNHNEDELI